MAGDAIETVNAAEYLGKTLDGARYVNFYQNPTNIENYGAKRSAGHG